MTQYDLSKPYIKYCEDILTHKIVSCEAVYLACKRFKSWFDKDDRYFDYEKVDKVIRFVSKLKHWTGEHAGKFFTPLPWQCFFYAGIYGWKWKSSNKRVTRKVLCFISRKNGKSFLAATLSLINVTIDDEPGAEVDLVANNAKQAKICYDMCKNLSESIDPNGIIYKRFRDSVKVPSLKSTIQVLSSDSMGNDGWNASMFIFDELHAARNWDLYNVLISSQGMRTQPLACVISTAGALLDGYPLFELRKTCIDILKGKKSDDTQFALMYELDENDDFSDKKNWLKCCPSLGQTVFEQYLQDQVNDANNLNSLTTGILTKNFNRFVQSEDTWIASKYIDSCMEDVNLSDFEEEYVYIGTDLASVSDLSAWCVLIPPNESREKWPDKFIFKNWSYVPQEAYQNSINRSHYVDWARKKELTVTDGNVLDANVILKDQIEVNKITPFVGLYYDTWNSLGWSVAATNEGLPLEPYSQSLGAFNKPTKYLEVLIKSDKVIIDRNSCVKWQFNNVKLMRDHNDNCKPDKPTYESKIDNIIAMVMALGGYLSQGGVDIEIV